ncbi:DUF6155 family protein [Cesiribacter andamanensis]|uniref:Uncharacterized protein n=1 Tax=Cesiribacter andamanensis AMV16 TaxID=1279009 RepID=M7N4B1_9BACT|nr:DUF6155 family protein [Cesiribacter andamanensis]EMR02056.1 hypothetical protein ADICEAN_02802 [Cesiribacter andamanensis AMV16]
MAIGVREVKKYLQELSDEELREEVMKLYKKFPILKEYYQQELSLDGGGLVADYKKKIHQHYFPSGRSPKRPRAAKTRELISRFRKLSPFSFDVADLLLYQVETMVAFSASKGTSGNRGYVSGGFNQTLISRYKEALQLVVAEALEGEFMPRLQQVLKEARFMRWGTYEALLELYIQHINKRPEGVGV